MISLAYYKHFIDRGAQPDRFVRMAQALGMKDAARPEDFLTALRALQEACGVANLRMSDYGITPDEFETMAHNARSAMGWLFDHDPLPLSVEDCVAIYSSSYR